MVTMSVSRAQVMERIRHFNRRILNPFTLSFAGRKGSIYTMIEHVGRRSGARYATPVLAMRHGDGFTIPLPYGTHVDWCRNILAAGGCIVAWQGQAFRTCDPQMLSPEEGLPAFPRFTQQLLVHSETQAFLHLRLAEGSSEDPNTYARLIAEHPGTDAWWVVLPALMLASGIVTLLWLTTRRSCRSVDRA